MVVLQRLCCVLLVGVLAFAAQAQDGAPDASPVRDAQSLAARYLGFTGTAPILPLTPIYAVGDKTQFWVAKNDSPTPVRVSATLAAAAPNLYLWVEDGISVTGDLTKNAATLGGLLTALRSHDNYRQSISVPGIGSFSDSTDLLPIPNVDEDDHLFVLYTTNLAAASGTIINPLDSQPSAYAPYSNQHEILYVDTTPHPGTPLDDASYNSQMILALYRWIIHSNVPTQAAWLTDALDWWLLLQFQQTKIDDASLTTYLQITDTPLIQPVSQVASLGEQQLFLGYFLQRYGSNPFIDLFLQPGSGITPLDDALKQHAISDPVSGALVTGRDAFADFALTNGLNLAFGDWRYVQNTVPLPSGVLASARTLDPSADTSDLSASQFGAQYFRYNNSDTAAATVALSFKGSPTVARLPMPAERDPLDAYYWSGFGGDHDATLTRAVDLTGVSKATLTFDAWYNLASDWDYGYVAASTDNGATWKALTASDSTASNTYGTAYGANFSGISNPVKPHPFPTIGVIIAGDGITISDVVKDGAGDHAGIQKGDQIIGYDHQLWSGKPDVIGLLANYMPGDTLNLYILHGTERIDVPVVLTPHPTRLYVPPPLWLPQTVDLTPYAGQKILLRFENVSLVGHEDQGFAVDNLAIPEIGWTDDASGDLAASGWTVSGWQQVTNQVAQHWIVQAATSGSQTTYPRVQRLISTTPTDRADAISNGEWRFSLQPNETITLVVTAVNDDTSERATYSVGFKK